jgi:ribosomal protein L10
LLYNFFIQRGRRNEAGFNAVRPHETKMKTREEKEKIVKELKQFFEKSSKVFFISLLNLNAEIQNSLRDQIKKIGGILKIAKKTLIKLANPNLDLEQEKFKIPFGLIFDLNDAKNIEIFKILTEFNKTYNLTIIEGLMQNRVLSPKEIIEIGKLPSYEVLLQKYNYLLKSLLGRLVFTLKIPISKLTLVVNNIKK